eukprot:TRINITY_DN82639_c0_g1_i1.p1 TRINITY_DN82639_c0_g1~~TRINITY_DN82639_c0_g1_i1.p1  ORF type:complete len:296 (+),score=15.93 TRINITY_DN82639_c0_g1_i1:82-888(+)
MRGSIFLSLLFVTFIIHNASAQVGARFIHAIPNEHNINVFFNGELVFRNLDFGSVTQYAAFEDGVYDVRIAQENNDKTIYEIRALELDDDHITLLGHGTTYSDEFPYAVTKLIDDNDVDNQRSRLRFYHAAAGLEAVDVFIDDDETFSDVEYTELSNYSNIDEGFHAVTLVYQDGEIAVGPSNVPFDEFTIVNVYFAGDDRFSSDRPTMIIAIDLETDPETESSGSALSISLLFTSLLVIMSTLIQIPFYLKHQLKEILKIISIQINV